MAFAPREGVRAKQVYISFIDAIRGDDGSTVSLAGTQFTSEIFDKFWGAYYGNLTENSVVYSIVDLGFDDTGTSKTFQTNAYDTVASVSGAAVTLTTNTGMTPDAHINNYVIFRLAATGKKLFARVIDNDADSITLDQDLSASLAASGDTVVLLDVPFGLTMDAWARLDHVATDLAIDPATTEADQQLFLGTSDAAGSQNENTDTSPPTPMTVTVTVRGGQADLYRLKYGQESTAPTGRIRYNFGSETSAKVGLAMCWLSDNSDPDASDNFAHFVICNDGKVLNIGPISSVASDGRAEATIEVETKAGQCIAEVVKAQVDDSDANV